ncbi:MAG TPA: DUF4126 domain-containing protein [Vicinamibacterales bacterium]|nr:DUF4126 domain-containing protein [Vicinamibacterales bacterium]
MTPESLVSIGVGLALAAAAGFRVFVPLLALSLAAQSGWIDLSPSFAWLATPPAAVALATATFLEIVAYYVPFFDNVLDTLAAPVAVLAGIVASASLLTDLPPWLQYSIAIIGAGGTAGVVHVSTSVLRLKSSAMTAGIGNPVLATLELTGSIVIAVLALLAPVIALVVAALLVRVVSKGFNARRLRNARAAARSSTH